MSVHDGDENSADGAYHLGKAAQIQYNARAVVEREDAAERNYILNVLREIDRKKREAQHESHS